MVGESPGHPLPKRLRGGMGQFCNHSLLDDSDMNPIDQLMFFVVADEFGMKSRPKCWTVLAFFHLFSNLPISGGGR
jgi:hypothetical protein